MGAERDRLVGAARDGFTPWHEWGPYVSERSWGTVREDYSADGEAWSSFPHDHARSRAYRWGEDGLAAICDRRQGMCLGLALWNGNDPILKERLFGLANAEGNHGEDAKEYWWYVDAVPTNSWLSWRYHYPQGAFPYEDLIAENGRRTEQDPEYELLDTGVFDDDRYWIVEVDYAKADVDDICMRIRVRNAGPEAATLHVLPTLWFRNTWSWGRKPARPRLCADDGVVVADHEARLGRWVLAGGPDPSGAEATMLFCENETNVERIYGGTNHSEFPKDGINDHLIHGTPTVNPDLEGSKASLWYAVEVAAGGSAELRVRLVHVDEGPVVAPALGESFDEVMTTRRAEADEYHTELRSPNMTDDEFRTVRRAHAGLLWSRQFYRYDVVEWLEGDPAFPSPPPGRGDIRNGDWRNVDTNDVILMPDKWEYPWFASWDLACHCVVMAQLDAAFAKQQLLLLTREWYLHANGQLPAYEWDFGDANPPLHAWAALRIFEIDGSRDQSFLERMFHKLLINFTWWVNRQDAEGNNVFEGGFLGLDNIGPFNRSKPLPGNALLEQSDGTAWMAMYCLDMLDIALVLAVRDHSYEDMAVKFLEHFILIAQAMDESGLWDEDDGFFYDVLRLDSGESERVKVRSMVGLIPLLAFTVVDEEAVRDLPEFSERIQWFFQHRPAALGFAESRRGLPGHESSYLLSMLGVERLKRVLGRVLDEEEFLSPHGLRSLSKHHAAEPCTIELGGVTSTVSYEPAESKSRLFGGNSNWRGPIWFPLNHLTVESLVRYHHFVGPEFTIEYPTGSGHQATLLEVALGIAERLASIFLEEEPGGRRPVWGGSERFQTDPAWRDELLFYEYFNGDDGAGLGASHQTGWTAMVASLIRGYRSWPALPRPPH